MPTPDPEARPLHRLHGLIREQYLRLVEVGSTPPTEEELLSLFSELYHLTAPMVEPDPRTVGTTASTAVVRAWFQRRASSTVGEMFDVYEDSRLVHTCFTREAAQQMVTHRNQALQAPTLVPNLVLMEYRYTDGTSTFSALEGSTSLGEFPSRDAAEAFLGAFRREVEEDRLKKNPNITILKSRDATLEEFKFDPSLFLKASAISWE